MMYNWTENGYGYRLFNKDNAADVVRFVYTAGRLFGEREKLFTDNFLSDILPKVLKECENDPSSILWEYIDEPISYLVARLINRLEGVTVFKGYAPCGDTDQEEMIGAYPAFPWEMTQKDKSISMGDVDMILEKYAKILNIQESPDYFEASYVG